MARGGKSYCFGENRKWLLAEAPSAAISGSRQKLDKADCEKKSREYHNKQRELKGPMLRTLCLRLFEITYIVYAALAITYECSFPKQKLMKGYECSAWRGEKSKHPLLYLMPSESREESLTRYNPCPLWARYIFWINNGDISILNHALNRKSNTKATVLQLTTRPRHLFSVPCLMSAVQSTC